MSEITGILSKDKSEIENFVNNKSEGEIIVAKNNLAIRIRGLKNKTYFYKTYGNRGWISLGTGLIEKYNKFKIMNAELWDETYSSGHFPKAGHFLFITWDENKLKIKNDSLGVRDLYYYKKNDILLFSSKVNEIVKFFSDLTIDFEAIGGDYILGERLSYKTEIKEIKKIGPDTIAEFTQNRILISKQYTLLDRDKSLYGNISEYFKQLFTISDDYKISLGLSGGVDSRILLAYLLRNKINFTTHSFGLTNDKDNIVARQMADKIGFENHIYNTFDSSKIISMFANFLSFNPFNTGLDRVPYYYDLSDFGSKDYVFIDGQFGEFIRNELYKKVRILETIRRLNDKNLLKIMKHSIPPIFSGEILNIMQRGAEIQIAESISDYRQKYAEFMNFSDYLALLYHFPNKMARDQARIDEYCLSMMPFAQSILIRSILYPHRKIFNEKIIEHISPHLKHYPLVKNNKFYPYNRYMKIFMIGKEKFIGRTNGNSHIYDSTFYSDKLKEYILDETNSSKFENSFVFNVRFVKDTVNAFYLKKETTSLTALKYFLSFYMVPQIKKLL